MARRMCINGVSLLMLAAALGCRNSVPDEYEVVKEQSSSSVPAIVEPEPLVQDVVDPPHEVESAAADMEETVPAAPFQWPDAQELSVDRSRPFAVPLPERIPLVSVAAGAATGDATNTLIPSEGMRLLIPEKVFTPDPQTGALRISYDDFDLLKVLNMEPVPLDAPDHFPVWLADLNGRKVVLRGWMFPPFRSEGISRFLMMRDSGLCCFGPTPKIYDKVTVTLQDGVTTNHIVGRPFDVTGTFVIEPVIDEDQWEYLYHLEDAVITE